MGHPGRYVYIDGWGRKRTCAHHAHGDERSHGYRVGRVLRLLARRGDAVEADVRVETGGGARDDARRAERHEPAVAGPVVAVPVVEAGDHDDGHHAQVDKRQEAVHVGRSLHADCCDAKV